jgi:hypothetical protein
MPDESAGTVGQAYLGPLDLPGPGLSPQLPDQFGNLRYAGASDGVTLAEEPPARVYGEFSSQAGDALFGHPPSLAFFTEAEIFDADDFGGGETIVSPGDVVS